MNLRSRLERLETMLRPPTNIEPARLLALLYRGAEAATPADVELARRLLADAPKPNASPIATICRSTIAKSSKWTARLAMGGAQ